MQTTIHSTANVSTAPDISKLEPNYFPVSFIYFLIKHNFDLVKSSNQEQVFILVKDYITIKFTNTLVQFFEQQRIDEEPTIRLVIKTPNTIDQWQMLLACMEYVKLPRNYKSDEDKLNLISNYVDSLIEVSKSLLSGSDNSEHFNIINSSYNSLLSVNKEILNIRRS